MNSDWCQARKPWRGVYNPNDPRLVIGSLVFGVGWGLAGFCPAPAVVAYGAGCFKAVVFVLAMLVGMTLYEAAERWRHRQGQTPGTTITE